jgi:Domain of unknown function (DUF3576)
MKHTYALLRTACLFGALLVTLSACSILKPDAEQQYPKTEEDRRKDDRGKITGDQGLTVGGPSENDKDAGKNPLGVNSFLWRATLDTLSFLPITTADPFGGTVLTEWYEAAEAPGERFKVNVLILDRQLRADSLKITTFRQTRTKTGEWADAPTDSKLGRKLEDTVLTRARELRVKQLGY